jgi:hypothetical protein
MRWLRENWPLAACWAVCFTLGWFTVDLLRWFAAEQKRVRDEATRQIVREEMGR